MKISNTPTLMILIFIAEILSQPLPGPSSYEQDNTIIFRDRGLARPAQGYSFLAIKLQLDHVTIPMTRICDKITRNLKISRETERQSAGHPWKFDARRLRQMIQQADFECQQSLSEMNTLRTITTVHDHDSPDRQKRDFGLFFAASLVGGLGALAVQALTRLLNGDSHSGADQAFLQELDDIENALNNHGDAILNLHDIALDADKEFTELQVLGHVTFAYSAIPHMVNAVKSMASKTKKIYDAATLGRVSMELVNNPHIGTSLNKLRDQVEKKGHRLMIENQLQLHQCDASYIADDSGITIIAEVPMVSDDDVLFAKDFVQWPLRFADGNWWQIELHHTVLIINKERDQFRTMTTADWNACKTFNHISICREQNLVRTIQPGVRYSSPPYCLFHLFMEDYDGIRETCKLVPTEPYSDLLQIGHADFIARNTDKKQIHVDCIDTGPLAVPNRLLTRISMHAGCTLKSPSHTAKIIAPKIPGTETEPTIYSFHEEELLATSLNISHEWTLQRLLNQHPNSSGDWTKDLHRFTQPITMRPDVKSRLDASSQNHFWTWTGTATAAIGLCLLGFGISHCYAKTQMKKFSDQWYQMTPTDNRPTQVSLNLNPTLSAEDRYRASAPAISLMTSK